MDETPFQTESGYHGFSGRVSTVKSGNRFRVSGFSGEIQLFGVAIPPGQAAANRAKVQLFNILRGEEVVCLLVHQVEREDAVVAYCKTLFSNVKVNRYLWEHGFADINCAEIREAFGPDEACRL